MCTIIKLAPNYARFVMETVQNLQFFIHIRFANNANGHICRIGIRRLIRQFTSGAIL